MLTQKLVHINQSNETILNMRSNFPQRISKLHVYHNHHCYRHYHCWVMRKWTGMDGQMDREGWTDEKIGILQHIILERKRSGTQRNTRQKHGLRRRTAGGGARASHTPSKHHLPHGRLSLTLPLNPIFGSGVNTNSSSRLKPCFRYHLEFRGDDAKHIDACSLNIIGALTIYNCLKNKY